MLPIGKQLGLIVGRETGGAVDRAALVATCAGDLYDSLGFLLPDKRSLGLFTGYAEAGGDTREVYVIAAGTRRTESSFGARRLGIYAGEATAGDPAETRPVYAVATCCPNEDGCTKAIDDFALADGSEPSGFWRSALPLVGSNRPKIVSGELGFAETNATLLHCTEFGLSGSIEVEVEGAAGDGALLIARHFTEASGLGDGWGLAYEIEADHHIFHLGVTVALHETAPGGSGFCAWSERYFRLPGGPGDRRKIRLCWFRDEDAQQDVAVGEVYDEYGELVFRERSRSWDGSLPSYLFTDGAAVRHGIAGSNKTTGATSTLKLDNYLASVPECVACDFDEFSICLQLINNNCGELSPDSQVLTSQTIQGTPLHVCGEHCVSRMHFVWAASTTQPRVMLGQTTAGEWIAVLHFVGGVGGDCCVATTLDLAGAYPTTENLMAVLEATVLTVEACCSGTTATVSQDLELCGYYDGGGDATCCGDTVLPDPVTVTILKNGAPFLEYQLLLFGSSSTGFTYRDDLDDPHKVLVCTTVSGESSLNFLDGDNGLSFAADITLVSCSPLLIQGSTFDGSGNTYDLEIVP